MEKSMFWNSINGDRVYNADDWSLARGMEYSNGVVYASENDLKVTESTKTRPAA